MDALIQKCADSDNAVHIANIDLNKIIVVQEQLPKLQDPAITLMAPAADASTKMVRNGRALRQSKPLQPEGMWRPYI